MDNNFLKTLKKLQPYKGPEEYVSDPYSPEDMVNDVANSSEKLSPDDINRIFDAESTKGSQLVNKKGSSAKGNFQFIDSTRQEMIDRLKKRGIDELPTNPLRLDAELMKESINKNEDALLNAQKGPLEPNLENIYATHHYGTSGGLKAITSPKLPASKEKWRHIKAQLAKLQVNPNKTDKSEMPAKNLLDLTQE